MNKVLIIEDNSVLLDSIGDFLKEEGFEIIKALNGEQGVEMAIRHLPDIILSDIYMPKMNGYEVFDKLKSTDSTSLIPFIFISAKAEKEDILFGMKMGADDYIIKPIDFPELLKRILFRIEKTKSTIQLSEVKYKALFETANDAILMVRLRDSSIVDANLAACRILEYEQKELLQISGTEVFGTGEGEMSILEGQQGGEPDEVSLLDTHWRSKTGLLIPIQVSARRIRLIGEDYLFLIARDITLQKTYERELILAKEKAEESDRLKSSILANMSHELRTPLNGILGFSELLKEELEDQEQGAMARNIHISGKWLMSTLDAILTLSQLDAGKVKVLVRETDLSKCIAETIKGYAPLAEEKDLYIRNLVVDPVILKTDEHLFVQLFRQILDNGIKFTSTGGITVEAVQTDKNVQIRVMDTGLGIESENIGLIFEEFRQVSEGLSRKFQGSGLGLSICKKVIRLLKGEISLESQPGKGSTFTIRLPNDPGFLELRSPSPTETLAVIPRTDHELPRVLIVEDNLLNRELTVFFLKQICRMDYATKGEKAVEMARANRYDAILMDINLGAGINGLDATRQIRKIQGYEKTPIIALTGYSLFDDNERLLNGGCSHYITKPYDKVSLVTILQDALAGR
jgi:PAS domain S-box-containing protein